MPAGYLFTYEQRRECSEVSTNFADVKNVKNFQKNGHHHICFPGIISNQLIIILWSTAFGIKKYEGIFFLFLSERAG